MDKKKLSERIKWVIVLFCIIFLGVIIWGLNFTDFGNWVVDVHKIMLGGDKINLQGDFKEIKAIDEELKDYDLFLGGEMHGTNMTYEVHQYMAKYFIENHGVQNIVLEMSISAAELLNEYLRTGDEVNLINVLNKVNNTFADNQETYELYKFYYDYNKELPSDKKLNFLGIDTEASPELVGIYLNSLIKDLGEPPAEINPVIEKIKDPYTYHDRFLVESLCKDIKANERVFQDYLGDKFFKFNLVVNNIYYDMTYGEREEAMVRNFEVQYEELGGAKYFGQLGRSHVQKKLTDIYSCGNGEVSTFANSINEDFDPLKSKVYSIVYLYANTSSNLGGIEEIAGDIALPYEKENGSVKIYDREKDSTVFDILMNEYQWSEEDFGDLLFIIKDSKAASKLNIK